MGNSKSKSTKQPNNQQKVTQISELYNQEEYQWDEIIETHQCCFIKYQKITKSKLVWQINFDKYLTQIISSYPQYQQCCLMLKALVKNNYYPRKKFYVQVNTLKYQFNKPNPQDNTILLSFSQLSSFKDNLKKSVLINYVSINQSLHNKSKKIRSISNLSTKLKLQRKIQKKQQKINIQNNKIQKINNQKGSQRKQNNFRQSLLSFFDNAVYSILKNNQKLISKEASYSLELFIKFTMIVQTHFGNPNCVLYNLKLNLVNYLVNKYHKLTLNQNLYPKSKDQIQKQIMMNSFIQCIKVFFEILKDTLYDYYCLDIFIDSENKYNLITDDQNLLNMVTAIVFKDQEFYNFLLQAMIEYNKQRQDQFRNIIHKIDKVNPQFFQVKPQFCLNYKQRCNSYQNIANIQQNFIPIQSQSFNQQISNPYCQCIYILQKIQKSKSPISKIKIILECVEKITQCINEFNQKNGIQSKLSILDGDQMLSIFCYIIVKANIKHLHSHLLILQHFLTNQQLISIAGYYYSVVSCAIQQIQRGIQKSLNNHVNSSN